MVGGNKSHTPFDSRLLLSLVKCEKEVADSFKSYTQTCENANNALNGWAAADTGDSPDVLTASNRVCELFDETFDAQRTYLMALNNYRSSLKDVAAREAEIRVILRDRDIFVSRLVKLNNKKPPTSDTAFEAHTAKLEEARAELAACESTLKAEERALVGVKRRIFREALRMRMRAMAQLADTWRDTAERAIDILDSLEPDNQPNGSMTDLRLRPQAPPPTQLAHTPSRQSNNRLDTFQSPEGSVIAPSHSASQVARRAAGIPADFSDDEGDTALGGVRDNGSLHRSASMNDNTMNGSNRRSVVNPPIAEVSHEEEMASGEGIPARSQPTHHQHFRGNGNGQNNRAQEDEEEGGGSSEDERGHELDPKLYQVHVNKPLTPRELAQQKARQLMAQKQADERQMHQPQGQYQQQSHDAIQQAAPAAGRRVSSTPVQSQAPVPAQQQQPGVPTRTASPYRETPEDRMKRFSTLTTTTIPPYDAATAPIAIPSAGTFTLDSYKKKNAPEATLLLPSATGLKGYQATRANADSDDEAVDEVGALKSNNRRRTTSTPGRPSHGRTLSNESESATSDGRGERRVLKKNSARDSAYYSRSDAGTSTVRGGDKRSKDKNRHEGHHKSSSGGFFGSIGGLFKKRDVQSGRKYGDDDDDDDSILGSPKSRGTRGDRNSSIWGGGSSKKKDRKSRIMEDSDSDAPDPRTLIKVQNNAAGRGRVLGGGSALSDVGIDRQTEAAIRAAVNSNTFSSAGTDRKKAMSDVGAPRTSKTGTVKKKKTATNASTGLTSAGMSPVSQTTALQPAGTVKKKKKVSATGPTTTTVANNLKPATSGLPGTMMIVSSSTPNLGRSTPTLSRSNTMTSTRSNTLANQNPAQRVTRETPSLMSVVAPPSQSSRVMNMPLPSAKNPSASANLSPSSPTGSMTPNLAPSPSGSALGVPGQPLKKKKTIKKSSTSSNVNGNLLQAPATASTLRPSATTPNLLGPPSSSTGQLRPAVKTSSALSAPRPSSILSVGSGPGGVARRKSVRLADDTKLTEARYENSGPPANIPRAPAPQFTAPNGSAYPGILKESTSALQTNHNVHDYSDAGVTSGAGVGEWSTRPGPEDDVSSDEGGDEYARIRHQLSRSERGWQDAGFAEKGKGKARAY